MFVLFVSFHSIPWHGVWSTFWCFHSIGYLTWSRMVWHAIPRYLAFSWSVVPWNVVLEGFGSRLNKMIFGAFWVHDMTWCGWSTFGGFHNIGYMTWSRMVWHAISRYLASPCRVVSCDAVLEWFGSRLEKMIFRFLFLTVVVWNLFGGFHSIMYLTRSSMVWQSILRYSALSWFVVA